MVPRKSGYFYVEGTHLDEEPPPRKYDPKEFKDLFAPVVVGGHEFMPLIREAVGLACSLDIVFMRKGEIGSLVSQDGDLDNRIKTLFDGLRMPTPNEMKNHRPRPWAAHRGVRAGGRNTPPPSRCGPPGRRRPAPAQQ